MAQQSHLGSGRGSSSGLNPHLSSHAQDSVQRSGHEGTRTTARGGVASAHWGGSSVTLRCLQPPTPSHWEGHVDAGGFTEGPGDGHARG